MLKTLFNHIYGSNFSKRFFSSASENLLNHVFVSNLSNQTFSSISKILDFISNLN